MVAAGQRRSVSSETVSMKRALWSILFVGLLAGVLFGCAGRLDLPFFWVWIAVPAIAATFMLRHMDADLMKERLRPGPGGRDCCLRIVAAPFWLAHLVIAALDVGRFHWSDGVPLALQITGMIIFTAGYALAAWAVRVNHFYSSVVRIQSDRGHVVVTTGPYRWIRHPGYAALLVGTPCGGLALGSWWSLAPLVPLLILILRRTIIEDRFLRENLAGYPEYAGRVRYQLLPGLW
jgi:protein-S-isoprenylcysteine O-methyltransferase Ste14